MNDRHDRRPAGPKHGQKGELRQRYHEGQEDQLGALGFLANVCVLWNTVYTARAIDAIRAEGNPVATADIARLSPSVEIGPRIISV